MVSLFIEVTRYFLVVLLLVVAFEKEFFLKKQGNKRTQTKVHKVEARSV